MPVQKRHLAFIALAAYVCAATNVFASNDVHFNFNQGIPSEISVSGVGWERRNDDPNRFNYYLENRPLAADEEASLTFDLDLDEPAILTLTHRRESCCFRSRELTLNINSNIIELYVSYQWSKSRHIIPAGQNTVSIRAQNFEAYASSKKVQLSSIDIELVKQPDAPLSVSIGNGLLTHRSEYEKITLQEIAGEPRVQISTELNRYTSSEYDDGVSYFAYPTESGHFITQGAAIETWQNVPSRAFAIDGRSYLASQRNWNHSEGGDLTLIDALTGEVYGSQTIRTRAYIFDDINNDARVDLIFANGDTVRAIDFMNGNVHWTSELEDVNDGELLIGNFTADDGQELVIPGKPGSVLSTVTGEQLWSYPLGFSTLRKLHSAGAEFSRFTSPDSLESLAVFDAQLRSPVNVLTVENPHQTFPIDIDGDGLDELIAFANSGTFQLLESETGSLLEQIQLDRSIVALTDVAIGNDNSVIATVEFENNNYRAQQRGLVNLAEASVVSKSFAPIQSSCCGRLSFDIAASPQAAGGTGHLFVTGLKLNETDYRVHALGEDTLVLDTRKSAVIDALLPDGHAAQSVTQYINDSDGSAILIVGTLSSRWDEPNSVYVIDATNETLLNSFPVPELLQSNWTLHSLGGEQLLAAYDQRVFLYNTATGTLEWSSVSFGEPIEAIKFTGPANSRKALVVTSNYIALLDPDSRLFDYFEDIPTGLEFLNSRSDGAELYFTDANNYEVEDHSVHVFRADDFTGLTTINTGHRVTRLWDGKVAGQHVLFMDVKRNWVKGISRESEELLFLHRVPVPLNSASIATHALASSASRSTFILETDLGLQKYEIAMQSDSIFSDAFQAR